MVEDVFVMAKERILPEPHRYAVCSPDDMPIKEFYKGVFEEVFVFYHPFIKPVTINYELFKPDTYPTRNDIRDNCEKVTWNQFFDISGIESNKKVDRGLRTLISGLKEKYQDQHSALLIEKTCREKMLGIPTEGAFPEFIMNDVLSAIKTIGHEWIWLGDEFCTERKLEYIDDLIEDNNILDYRAKNLFTHDNRILITTHWDSHFSLLCSDKNTVEQFVQLTELEGFYCNDKTEIYWSVINDC